MNEQNEATNEGENEGSSPVNGKNDGTVLVGLDEGYREMKVAFRKNGVIVGMKCASSVRVGALGLSSPDSHSASYSTKVDGNSVTFTVGEFHDAIETRFPDFPVSPVTRVLANHVLILSGFGGRQVSLGTGLPPGEAYLPTGEKNLPLIDRKKANLSIPVVSKNGAPVPVVVKSEVYVQGIGALVDFLASERQTAINAPVGVVDVGGKTVDVAVIVPGDSGMSVDMRRSGSESIGVLDAMETLANLLRSRFNLSEKIPAAILEKSLTTGSVRIFGSTHDIADLVTEAKNEIMERLHPFITAKLGRGQSLDKILYTGGGSLLLPTLMEQYPHVVLSPDPQFANARGFLLYLEMMMEKGTSR